MKSTNEIKALSQQEYIKLGQCFSAHDWKAWAKEIIKDSQSGHLDFLINEAPRNTYI